ncbi:hypothetical protein E1301_Tti021476 [Triplophysa tibetana]|uniref:C2H2-type domain-containing protein n=1 Tax=Triplophysa tibetana TaxID=1572043 RepID=A0A5A9PCI7_9TELE|nr:hypothetical protein E1301_Tti021476 [Triplophysa tibetana]
MSHCSFQTQFGSIMDILAQAALPEIHRRVDDRCALVRKDIDALKRKCVMMEIEMRRVKGRFRRRVWISGTSVRCPTSLKSGRVVTSQQHPPNPQHIHNIQEVLQVLDDECPDIKEERENERENVAFERIPPQENAASSKSQFEDPEVQNALLLLSRTYSQPSEQLKLQVEKDIKEEKEISRDPHSYVPLWPSVTESTVPSPNSTVLSQTNKNQQHPTERAQKESSKSIQTFKRCDQLKEHLRSHTDEKPFMCVQCGHSFTKHSNLTRHAVVHSGKKPFQCLQCGKCFTRRCNLSSHHRIHTGNIT